MPGKRVKVDFISGTCEVVPLSQVLTVGGSAPCPPLAVRHSNANLYDMFTMRTNRLSAFFVLVLNGIGYVHNCSLVSNIDVCTCTYLVNTLFLLNWQCYAMI